MLLGGKGGCQQCTCVPCNPCERTCTNPHTGTAFEAVYTRYFEGAEDGNVSDGYLTATGDSDTSDPYDGMDGNGPWFQQVAGEFTLDPSTTRHPCSVTVSFWRNNYVLGAATIPPPATTTTMNRIRVSVSASSGGGVFVEGADVAIGATRDIITTIPLVSGSGDQSANDPRTYNGSATVTPECHNRTTIFTIEARIEWSVKKRQHVVYGLVRECYDYPPGPCDSLCSGGGKPATLYVTLTSLSFTNAEYNYAGDGTSPGPSDTVYAPAILSDWQSILTSAVAVARVVNLCNQWQECLDPSGGLCSPCVNVAYKDWAYGYGGLTSVGAGSSNNLMVYLMSTVNYNAPGVLGGCNEWVLVSMALGDYDPCSPFDQSGSATGDGLITSNTSGYGGIRFDVSCNWRVTT